MRHNVNYVAYVQMPGCSLFPIALLHRKCCCFVTDRGHAMLWQNSEYAIIIRTEKPLKEVSTVHSDIATVVGVWEGHIRNFPMQCLSTFLGLLQLFPIHCRPGFN